MCGRIRQGVPTRSWARHAGQLFVNELHGTASRLTRGKAIGLGFVFLWFFIGGIAHFVATDLEIRIVPPSIPSPRLVVWVSGAFELLGAVGLLVPVTRRLAGVGLFLLTLAVTPANVYMLEHAAEFSVPYWALVVRLPIQVGLLTLIAWSSGAWRLFMRR
jgi:uncharacterized membrane protein